MPGNICLSALGTSTPHRSPTLLSYSLPSYLVLGAEPRVSCGLTSCLSTKATKPHSQAYLGDHSLLSCLMIPCHTHTHTERGEREIENENNQIIETKFINTKHSSLAVLFFILSLINIQVHRTSHLESFIEKGSTL